MHSLESYGCLLKLQTHLGVLLLGLLVLIHVSLHLPIQLEDLLTDGLVQQYQLLELCLCYFNVCLVGVGELL